VGKQNPSSSIGLTIRAARLAKGLSLTALAQSAGASKAYLSMLETGRCDFDPADDKLAAIEQALGLQPDTLVSQAQLNRTPAPIRAILQQLGQLAVNAGRYPTPANLDAAFLNGLLQRAVDQHVGNITSVPSSRVPLINKVAAGYPSDFTDLSYPKGVADDYVQAPTNNDPDAFAARVFGDSMQPRYQPGDIVIFSPAASFNSGDDCFVRFDDGTTTFKRVFLIDPKPSSDSASTTEPEPVVRVVARNPAYPTIDYPAHRIAGLYRAIYSIRPISGDDSPPAGSKPE
jgi:repressor LexA